MRLIAKMYCAGFCAYPFTETLEAQGVNIIITGSLCFIFGLACAIAIPE